MTLRNRRIIVGSVLLIVLAAVPVSASAASFLPLVPCGSQGQPSCTPCMLFATAKNIIDLILYGVTGPVAAFMVVIAGGMMMLGGGNPQWYGQGKKLLQNTLIGVTIILLSWTATSFLIKAIAKDEVSTSWYTFKCPEFLQEQGDVPLPGIMPSRGSPDAPDQALISEYKKACDETQLSKAFGTAPDTKKNAPSLDQLISCIRQDKVVEALLDTNQIYTYERSNPLCNVSRGIPVCGGKCAHSMYSCHYGGKTGNQGAMGVDFNWNGRTVTYDVSTRQVQTGECPQSAVCRTRSGEQGLWDEIYHTLFYNSDGSKRDSTNPRCKFGLMNWEIDHTHMSTFDCDADKNKGVRGKR